LVSVLLSFDYQSEIINKLAAECAMGRPGSTLYMSKPSTAPSKGPLRSKSSLPQLFYIKVSLLRSSLSTSSDSHSSVRPSALSVNGRLGRGDAHPRDYRADSLDKRRHRVIPRKQDGPVHLHRRSEHRVIAHKRCKRRSEQQCGTFPSPAASSILRIIFQHRAATRFA
jgi:hypothetical protein